MNSWVEGMVEGSKVAVMDEQYPAKARAALPTTLFRLLLTTHGQALALVTILLGSVGSLGAGSLGCIGSDVVACDDGLLCPPGMACDPAHGGCVFPGQLTACIGLEEGDGCTFSGSPEGMYKCVEGICLLAERCGDGVRNGAEDCDGADLGSSDCGTFGYYGGTLGCSPLCSFDLSGCQGRCGNGTVEGAQGEECDGENLNAETCQTLGMDGGELRCNLDCTFDRRACLGCGNDIMETGEQCDGVDFGGLTCLQTSSHAHGELQCTSGCELVTTGCHTCGNSSIEGPEVCDGINMNGETCLSQTGLGEGALSCQPGCLAFDTTDCHFCGNQVIDGPEACDGPSLGGATCASLSGHEHGTPTCNPTCTFNIAGCHTCGNGTIELVEECDAGSLNGISPEPCRSNCTFTTCGDAYIGGTEECDAGSQNGVSPEPCKTDCTLTICGDAYIGGTEECDGSNLASRTCQDFGYVQTSGLTCSGSCLFDTIACTAICGNGVIEPGEECDAGAQNGVNPEPCKADCTLTVCGDGYLGGTETCDAGAQNGVSPEPCRADCTLTVCGDGYLGGGEACDEGAANSDLPDAACRTDCTPRRCGDGIIDDIDGEACDTSALAGQTCSSFGYVAPEGLACDPTCLFDTAACTAVCGNGVTEPGEECDDGAANSDTDPDACRTTCLHAHCGDGVADTGETCDGNDFAGSTVNCADYGYVDPVGLSCSTGCAFETSTCNAVCGNMVIEPTEECDDGNFDDGDGCHSNCLMEECAVFVNKDPSILIRDGLSWATAHAKVQEGIDDPRALEPSCEVWVAQGAYHIYETGPENTVQLRNGVSLYGGFFGNEYKREQRDWETYLTVLDGTQDGSSLNRVYHVVTGANTVIDGFVITRGKTADEYANRFGGGMYNYQDSPIVTNCVFAENSTSPNGGYGGGMFNREGSPVIENCIFFGNWAAAGGAIYNWGSAATINNSIFINNFSNAIQNDQDSSNTVIDNCVFAGNHGAKGAVYGRTATLDNCVFSGNFSKGLHIGSGSMTVTNSTFAGNVDDGAFGQWTDLAFTNCVFAGNGRYGLYAIQMLSTTVTNCTFTENLTGIWSYSLPTVMNSIFWGNTKSVDGGDYLASYSNIQEEIPAGPGNISEDPLFVAGPDNPLFSGAWTWVSYDATRYQTVLVFDATTLVPGSAKGLFVRPEMTDPRWFVIAGNTADALRVWGDMTELLPGLGVGSSFEVYDLRLSAGSPCIDAADGDVAPELDIEGNPRYDDPATANSGTGMCTYVDMGAYEYQGP